MLFVIGGAAGVSSLTGCATDVEEIGAELNRQVVEAEVEKLDSSGATDSSLDSVRRAVRAAMPDAEIALYDVVASGDEASAILEVTGTLHADFMGVPATASRVTLHIDITTTHDVDGQIREYRTALSRRVRADLARIQ
jgi:predicted ester cyclase